MINFNKQTVEQVYDILVKAGAREDDRYAFTAEMLSSSPTSEWRFSGKFGVGGKYRPGRNSVDMYVEDETQELRELLNTTNVLLSRVEFPSSTDAKIDTIFEKLNSLSVLITKEQEKEQVAKLVDLLVNQNWYVEIADYDEKQTEKVNGLAQHLYNRGVRIIN